MFTVMLWLSEQNGCLAYARETNADELKRNMQVFVVEFEENVSLLCVAYF